MSRNTAQFVTLIKMPAFSRGCLSRRSGALHSSQIHALFFPKSSQFLRPFTSTPFLEAKKAKKRVSPPTQPVPLSQSKALASKPPPIKTPTSKIPHPNSTPITYQSYITTLALKNEPTLLYSSSSQISYHISCYSASTFCYSYAFFAYYSNVIMAPADLATWVSVSFTGICAMMAGFGLWLLLGPSRLIKTIIAVPSSVKIIGKPEVKDCDLLLEITLRKMFPIPFFPARKLYIRPHELVLPTQLVPPATRILTPEELRVKRVQDAELQRQFEENEKGSGWRHPLRAISQGAFTFIKAVGRTWTRQGFLKVEIQEGKQLKPYKLDLEGPWILDGGKALDRVAALKPQLK